MSNKDVILIPKEDKYVSYRVLNEDHASYLKKYIIENEINIPNIDDIKLSGQMANILAKEGLVVIIVEDRTILIYLPEKITKNQYDWFSKMSGYLSKFKVEFSYIDDGELKYYENEYDTTQIKELYKYIKKNIKNKKDSDINEHGRSI